MQRDLCFFFHGRRELKKNVLCTSDDAILLFFFIVLLPFLSSINASRRGRRKWQKVARAPYSQYVYIYVRGISVFSLCPFPEDLLNRRTAYRDDDVYTFSFFILGK